MRSARSRWSSTRGISTACRSSSEETGRRVYTVLQLRLHPALVGVPREAAHGTGEASRVQLAYLTARGRWYDVSWKGVEERSGGIVTNIGIHFFDLLVWLFGEVQSVRGPPARRQARRRHA